MRTAEDGRGPRGSRPRRPLLGMTEWFRPDEHERVERVLERLRELGVARLRTGISWADWCEDGGPEWYGWLFPRLAREVEVLPCLPYASPSLGGAPRGSASSRRRREYADVLDLVISRVGEHFEYVELWGEPNDSGEWDRSADPGREIFSRMMTDAAHLARERGKKAVLGGMATVDPGWLGAMWNRGVMESIDVIGIHGFPGTWEGAWHGWDTAVARVREVCAERGASPAVWVTQAGHPTWNHDEIGQAERFLDVQSVDADRVYWYAVEDLAPERPTVRAFHGDERAYHFGLYRNGGPPKLLGRLLATGGVRAVRDVVERMYRLPGVAPRGERYDLITGGCGFIGTNLARALIESGRAVRILDNLSRAGVEDHLRRLHDGGSGLEIVVGDVRDPHLVEAQVKGADRVFHLAAQVAVTTSFRSPRLDFDVNVGGTLNVLEAAARADPPPTLLFASTNKVYGALHEIDLRRRDRRWDPAHPEVRAFGIGEDRPLDFHTPYGCSKGAADQYVLDFARSFGVPAAVLRLSCVYGPQQLGTEDQGWVAHFLSMALRGEPLTVFGDGRQVRDILFVADLVELLVTAADEIEEVRGRALNVGGGPKHTVSLLELLALIEEIGGAPPPVSFTDARPGDQRYYVSDVRRADRLLGWRPRVAPDAGVRRLWESLSRQVGEATAPARVPGRAPAELRPHRVAGSVIERDASG